MNVARAVARVESVNFAGFCSGFYWLKSGKNILIIYAPESARAVARARPVGKFAGFHSGFCWLKSGEKTY